MYRSMVILVPVLLPALVYKAVGDNDTENIIVKYYDHAEAVYPADRVILDPVVSTIVLSQVSTTTTTISTTSTATTFSSTTPKPSKTSTTPEPLEITEGVVFIPNVAPVVRVEDQYDSGGLRLQDLIDRQTIGDLMPGNLRVETESPQSEVVFVPGNNNDFIEKPKEIQEKSARRNNMEVKEKKPAKKILNCTNLDCNNTMKTICGGKVVNQKIQYRIFLNECYFRKVNCNFKYEYNRYTIMPPENCRKNRPQEKPFSFTRKNLDSPKKKDEINRKMSYSSRRSLSMNMNGIFCSHPCPVSCPEDYEPECAISSTGQRRVFMNHCKLDDNSCLYNAVWHKRPLSECVGGKMADLRQNRHFIDWMRRIGIIDKKGKLVLE